MTHVNINRQYYAALTVNGEKRIELGRAVWPEICTRAFANLKAFTGEIESANITIGITKESLARAVKSNGQAKYAHAGEDPESPLYGFTKDMVDSIQMVDDDAPSPFEGLSMNRLMEGQASDEYKAYLYFALTPDNRVGVSDGVIQSIRQQWRNAYPDVAVHVPVWKD